MKRFFPSLAGISAREYPIPRQHLYAIMMLAGFSVASVTLLPAPGELLRDTPITIDTTDLSNDASISQQAAGTEFVAIPDRELIGNDDNADDVDEHVAADPQWTDYRVKDDDNLSIIFDTLNLPAKTLQQLLQVDIRNSLIRLKPGQQLSFLIDEDNQVQQLRIALEQGTQVLFERKGERYVSHLLGAQGEPSDKPVAQPQSESRTARVVPGSPVFKGTINAAFGRSARNAGLNAQQIRQITRLFQGRIDFRRDLRRGDSYRVLLDKPAVGGKASADAKVLAVSFNVKGRTLNAYRHSDDQFYDADGSGLVSGTFLRYPIPSMRRVSSGFSPRRRNPVTGVVMPHNGTDFAVRVGTPVLATGSGVVVKATSHRAAGRYIILRHNGKYSTQYMHLSKLLVKPGQKVKQGQTIGLSGNTGRSTGPHLHYEFRVNDRAVDPMRVDLPVNDPMSGKQRRAFLAKVREYDRKLNG